MTTPALAAASNFRMRINRTVDVSNGQVVIDPVPDYPYFWASVTPPDSPAAPGDDPRQAPTAMLRHASRLTGPALDLRAGFRVENDSGTLIEILDNGTPVTTGSRLVGMSFACLPVDWLYPLTGVISDMDGNPTGIASLAIWGASESHDVSAGEFEDYDGSAAIEYASGLMRNVDLMVGTTRYRILAAETDMGSMYVRLRLRKADDPLAP
jgi:hypothetical protein